MSKEYRYDKSPLSALINAENRDLISRCDNIFLQHYYTAYMFFISYLFVLSHILGFQGNKNVDRIEMIPARLFSKGYYKYL
mgnify:FL=1